MGLERTDSGEVRPATDKNAEDNGIDGSAFRDKGTGLSRPIMRRFLLARICDAAGRVSSVPLKKKYVVFPTTGEKGTIT